MNMGDYVFKLPDIGEGVVEGEIVTWHVKVGDSVAEDDSIVDVMTDKATVTIPSPTNGVVKELSGDVGDMIAVGTALITFSNDGVVDVPVEEEKEDVVTSEPEIKEETTKLVQEKIEEKVDEKTPTPVNSIPEKTEVVSEKKVSGGRVLASPAVRRRAREADLDLTSVSGSGPAGRIRHADLDAFIAAGGAVSGAPPQSYSTKRTDINEIKVVGLRRKIAEQMVKSKFSIPHFSYFEEVDVTELEKLRKYLNSTKDDSQPKLTYLPFIMMALAKIMPNHIECNAHYLSLIHI